KYKEFCYGGFGKEFVGLVESRDIRKTEQMTTDQLKTIYDWCLLAQDFDGTSACIKHAVNSLYWGGENKPDVSVHFCTAITNSEFQDICFQQVIGSFKYYQ